MKKILITFGALLVVIFSSWGISSALAVDDTTPPSTPTSLAATVISNAQINLNWASSTDDVGVSGYAIFRNGLEINTMATTTFSDLGLSASTTYAYSIKAFDAAGNRSGFSDTVFATTLASPTDTTAPSAPTNLNASVISSSQINLSWTAASDNVGVVGYKIFRGGMQVATTTGTTFINTGLTASTTYSFLVKACDAAGNISAASNAASVTTLAATSTDITIPSAPANLVAHVISFQHVNLKWSTSTDNVGVVGYIVLRDGVQINKVKNNHYNDIGLTASTTYSYLVKAYDAAGNISAASNTITVTTLGRNNDNPCQCKCECKCECEYNDKCWDEDPNPIHILKDKPRQKIENFNNSWKKIVGKQSHKNEKKHNK